MQVHFGVELLRAEWRTSVTCVGTFDGVHLGHQAVIHEAVSHARNKELPCVLVTFDRHPAAILAPSRCPKALAALQENLEAFKALGVSATVVLPFDAELSRMSAERFLREILIGAAKACSIVVGHDFAMGNGREGTTDWLASRIPTTVVSAFEIDGIRVSSSRIREAVAAGRMEEATRLLGRPFALSGVVVGGQKMGRQLGFPTANIARSFDQAIPAQGIYAGWLTSSIGRFMAATSIGVRPAVGGGDQTVEAYLLDYTGDSLYGLAVELELTHRLREERDFPSLEALTLQINVDVEETRRILNT
jgi:riboflavin kinase/FMN adenylyltransferase